MKYRVMWSKIAENDLIDFWLNSADRQLFSSTVNYLENLLTNKPLIVGESRESSTRRVIYQDPIGFAYEVVEDDKMVVIKAIFSMIS